jgi:hypothetical protein
VPTDTFRTGFAIEKIGPKETRRKGIKRGKNFIKIHPCPFSLDLQLKNNKIKNIHTYIPIKFYYF